MNNNDMGKNMTTTIDDQDFHNSITAGVVSNNILEAIRDADSWEPEALNQHIAEHPALAGEETTAEQTTQALLYTLHTVLEAVEAAGVREDVEARIDV